PWSRTGPLDRRRVQLVRAIDRWVTLATPAPGPGDADEQTIGQLVDRLAHQTVLAYLPDDPAYPASPRMVALADRYQARLDDLRTGPGTPPARRARRCVAARARTAAGHASCGGAAWRRPSSWPRKPGRAARSPVRIRCAPAHVAPPRRAAGRPAPPAARRRTVRRGRPHPGRVRAAYGRPRAG